MHSAGRNQRSKPHRKDGIVVKNFIKNRSTKGRVKNMVTEGKIYFEYDEMFCDEISIKLLYQHRRTISGFVDDNNEPVRKSEVVDWIMENYYNDRKFNVYCQEGKGKIPETAEQLYRWNEEYRRSVDEERLYLLYLIGTPVTNMANIFGVSRQTVYSRIKAFEENRLHEFLQDDRVY